MKDRHGKEIEVGDVLRAVWHHHIMHVIALTDSMTALPGEENWVSDRAWLEKEDLLNGMFVNDLEIGMCFCKLDDEPFEVISSSKVAPEDFSEFVHRYLKSNKDSDQ